MTDDNYFPSINSMQAATTMAVEPWSERSFRIPMKSDEEFDRMMDQIMNQIMEHCDSARIFLNRHDPGTENTRSYSIGKGNIHAQRDQVREWLLMQDVYTQEAAKRNVEDEDHE